jgi:hypothetical protein
MPVYALAIIAALVCLLGGVWLTLKMHNPDVR